MDKTVDDLSLLMITVWYRKLNSPKDAPYNMFTFDTKKDFLTWYRVAKDRWDIGKVADGFIKIG